MPIITKPLETEITHAALGRVSLIGMTEVNTAPLIAELRIIAARNDFAKEALAISEVVPQTPVEILYDIRRNTKHDSF